MYHSVKKSIFILLLLIFLLGCSPSAEPKPTTKLNISAAASMMDSLFEIERIFTKENPDIQIAYNFGGSGSLRKQIEQGAPIDLFFSASETDYNKLVEQNMIEKGTSIFKNKLVLIKSEDSSVNSFNDFLQQHENAMMAIGTPEAVPAGTYAKEALEKIGAWSELKERLVFTKDVSQVVTYVREGAVDVGIVYASDILDLKDVTLLETFDQKLHCPIEYYVAVIENSEQDVIQAKEQFYQFILDESAQEIFKAHGFDIEK